MKPKGLCLCPCESLPLRGNLASLLHDGLTQEQMYRENQSEVYGNFMTYLGSHIASLLPYSIGQASQKGTFPHRSSREMAIDHLLGKASIFCKKSIWKGI